MSACVEKTNEPIVADVMKKRGGTAYLYGCNRGFNRYMCNDSGSRVPFIYSVGSSEAVRVRPPLTGLNFVRTWFSIRAAGRFFAPRV